MVVCFYIKTRHRFVSNHSRCLVSVCSKNASEFQDISVRDFQFGETTEYQEVKGNRNVKSTLFPKIFADKKELLESGFSRE